MVASGTAVTKLTDDQENAPGDIVVGDLLLADNDEGPGDGVSSTFVARNLAPGDERSGTLTILRETGTGTSPLLDPTVAIAFLDEGIDIALARALHITQMSYGSVDLAERLEGHCGGPVSMATLFECPERVPGVLDGLPDPGPDGTDLVLAIRFAPDAGAPMGSGQVPFTVEVTLDGEAPLDPEPPSPGAPRPPRVGSDQPAVAPGTSPVACGLGDDAELPVAEEVDVTLAFEPVLQRVAHVPVLLGVDGGTQGHLTSLEAPELLVEAEQVPRVLREHLEVLCQSTA